MHTSWTLLSAVLYVAVASTAAAGDVPPQTTATVAAPPDSAAPPMTAVPTGYQEAANLGFEAFERGDYGEARTHFLTAHGLSPNARVLKVLAMVEYELGNYPASIAFGEQALASQERPLSHVSRVEAEQLLTRARGYVSYYTLTLKPRDATVRLDGANLAVRDGDVLTLMAGPHSLEVHAPLHQTHRSTLQVMGGETEQLSFALSKRGGPSETPLRKKWWLWTGVGALVAGGVTAGVLVALRNRDDKEPTVVPSETSGALLRF
ncbi:MAG: tetratricopeptide repeat protein [Polyangiales bacterium]